MPFKIKLYILLVEPFFNDMDTFSYAHNTSNSSYLKFILTCYRGKIVISLIYTKIQVPNSHLQTFLVQPNFWASYTPMQHDYFFANQPYLIFHIES